MLGHVGRQKSVSTLSWTSVKSNETWTPAYARESVPPIQRAVGTVPPTTSVKASSRAIWPTSRWLRRVLLALGSAWIFFLLQSLWRFHGRGFSTPSNSSGSEALQKRDRHPISFPSEPIQTEGSFFFISSEQHAVNLREPLCLVSLRRSASAIGFELPSIALQSLTIAYADTSSSTVASTVLDTLHSVAMDPTCHSRNDDEGTESQPLTDLLSSVTVVPASTAFRNRPALIISIQDDSCHEELVNAIGYEPRRRDGSSVNTTWICLPETDLSSSGWILTLSEEALAYWYTPIWKLLVITNDRVHSLQRLVKSLRTAHYYGDSIDLFFKADAFADDPTTDEIDRVADPDSLSAWPHGHSHISFRFRQAGLIANIVEAWYPAGNNEYAFFFEDDIEASPYFFAWAKLAILTYRYGPQRHSKRARDLYAVSLYQAKTNELDPKTGRVLWNATSLIKKELTRPGGAVYHENSPFLLQVPCSWGAVYFPEHWREFHRFLIEREKQELVPLDFKIVWPKVVSNGWRTSWKRYLIELAYLRGYQTLYPNYPDFVSLSTNHVELGHHIDVDKQAILKPMQFLPLMRSDDVVRQLPHHGLPSVHDLPAFDLWGRFTSDEVLYTLGWERQLDMYRCNKLEGGAKLERRLSDYQAQTLFGCLHVQFDRQHNETNWQRFLKAKWLTELGRS